MDLTNLQDLTIALKLAGLKPNKDLGQHFLIDSDALEGMVETAKLCERDTVLEIGPGVGTLTVELLKRAEKVIAVEKDNRFVSILRGQFPQLEIHQQDFRSFNLDRLPVGYKVAANLPYYITSSIIQALLTSTNPPRSITILIQKEVAERITAQPGQMSVLAFSVQYFAKPKLIQIVPRTSFWPSPEVDSAVLQIDVRRQPFFKADPKTLFRLVKAGFGEKRKQLKNSLAGGLNLNTSSVNDLLQSANISPTARAQELSLEQWHKLYEQARGKMLL